MDKDGDNHVSSFVVVGVMLFGSDLTHDNRVNTLQVRWVGKQLNCKLLSTSIFPGVMSSQMILDISRVSHELLVGVGIGWSDTLELGEDDLHWLSNNVGQHIKSTSMWHTDNNLFAVILNEGVHDGLHAWDETFAALKTKSLQCVEFILEEDGKHISPEKSGIDELNLFGGQVIKLHQLELVSNPIALLSTLDEHEFDSDFVAVRFLHGLDEISENPLVLSLEDTIEGWDVNVESSVKICLRKAIIPVVSQTSHGCGWSSIRRTHGLTIVMLGQLKGVQVSLEMAVRHVGQNECHNFESIGVCLLDVLHRASLTHSSTDTSRFEG